MHGCTCVGVSTTVASEAHAAEPSRPPMTRYGLRRRPKMGSPSVRKPYTGLMTHGRVVTPMSAACSPGDRPSWSLRK
eukprot:scaffold71379_cov60-Phaeocystis_antarctica.AAC.2